MGPLSRCLLTFLSVAAPAVRPRSPSDSLFHKPGHFTIREPVSLVCGEFSMACCSLWRYLRSLPCVVAVPQLRNFEEDGRSA